MALSRREVGIKQLGVEFIVVSVSSGGTVDEGKSHVTCTKGATGNYTLTLNEPARRNIRIVGYAPETANLQLQKSTTSTSSVLVIFTNNSGTATDTNFEITLCVFRWPEQF